MIWVGVYEWTGTLDAATGEQPARRSRAARSINVPEYSELRDTYGCNQTMYDEIHPKFDYFRSALAFIASCPSERFDMSCMDAI